MDNLDQLTDDDLRRRLVQFGFPNLPVTSTTRKVLVKKLRNYMDTEKSKLRRQTTNATRYSSDEGEGSDDHHRATSSSSTRRGRATVSSMPPPPPLFVAANQQQRHTTQPAKSKSPPNVYVSPVLHHRQQHHQNHNGDTTDEDELEELNRSSAAAAADDFSFGRINRDESANGHHNNSSDDSPYISEFTKRLLNLRGTTVSESRRSAAVVQRHPSAANKYLNDLSIHHNYLPPSTSSVRQRPHQPQQHRYTTTASSNCNNNNNKQNNSVNKSATSLPIGVAFSQFINKLDERYGFKQSLIPFLLLSILFAFFAAVAFMYITISPDIANTVSRETTIFTPCAPGSHHGSGDTCIPTDQIEPALELLKLTATELQRRIVANRCVDAGIPFTMSANEVIKHAIDHRPNLHVGQTISIVRNMEYLIDQNPQWRISLCDAALAATTTRLQFSDPATQHLRATHTVHFAILQPRLPFTCSLYNKLQTFFLAMGAIALTLTIVYGLYIVVTAALAWRAARRDRVNALVADIINALMEKSINFPGQPDAALFVVNHLRDQLLAPAQRQQLDWAWKEAITFLEHNESRVQFEVGTRNGEDVRMMRWIATVSAHLSPRSSVVKKWQSPAFDKTNKIKDPPTPCLKIRQMFDKYEATGAVALQQQIQDAILEKVAAFDCKIYDIQLDAASCCVYVRCATSADAGIVHEQINGWWFDSRLVSIKFLRLDRYLHRFPAAAGGPKCLRPSNTKNLSMEMCRGGGAGGGGGANEDDDDDYEN